MGTNSLPESKINVIILNAHWPGITFLDSVQLLENGFSAMGEYGHTLLMSNLEKDGHFTRACQREKTGVSKLGEVTWIVLICQHAQRPRFSQDLGLED
jgi:hypothetical protein